LNCISFASFCIRFWRNRTNSLSDFFDCRINRDYPSKTSKCKRPRYALTIHLATEYRISCPWLWWIFYWWGM